jgi:hypothetical protein
LVVVEVRVLGSVVLGAQVEVVGEVHQDLEDLQLKHHQEV